MALNKEALSCLVKLLQTDRNKLIRLDEESLGEYLEEKLKDFCLLGFSFERLLEQYDEFILTLALGEDDTTTMTKKYVEERKASLMNYVCETIEKEVGTAFDETAFLAIESLEVPFLYEQHRHRVPNLKKLMKEIGVDCFNWSDEQLLDQLSYGVYRLSLTDEQLVHNYKNMRRYYEKYRRRS